ncbi:hypothetical protein MTO96_030562 [Rhipicephalus appendiculatus]
MWRSLVTGAGSPRSEVLLNIDPLWNMSALRVGPYKYIYGTYHNGDFDEWYEPPQDGDYQPGLHGLDATSASREWTRHRLR